MLPLLLALATGTHPVLLQDLAPGAALDAERYLDVDTGATPNLLVIETPFWGAELFTVSDGRRTLVADLCPGPCGSYPSQLTRVNGRILFVTNAFFPVNGFVGRPLELWSTDGTATGTVKLADDVAFAPRLTALDTQVLFNRTGKGIWVTDGTPAGTGPVAWGKGRSLTSSQSTPAHRFAATKTVDGHCTLFVSGTDVRNAAALQMPAPTEECGSIATLGERAYLSFTTGVWRFEAGAGAPLLIDAQGRNPVRVADGLFFFGFGPATLSLFRSTGEPNASTALGTVPSEGLRQTVVVGPRLLYSVVEGTVERLHASDGTTAGTVTLGTVNQVLSLVAVGPVAYAAVRNGLVRELVETDGTTSGTVVVQGIHPAEPEPGHSILTGHALALAFIGTVVAETGVFRLRPGEEAETVFAKPGNPRDSFSLPPRANGTQAFFTSAGTTFRTDGTPEGTSMIADGGLLGFVRDRLLVFDGTQVRASTFDGGAGPALLSSPNPWSFNFGARALVSRDGAPAQLFVTDGTTATPFLPLGNGSVLPPVALDDGRAVFPLVLPTWRLMFTDGTAEGSTSVDADGLGPFVGGTDVVWAVGPANSVWRVGTNGRRRVHPGGARPASLTPLDGALFFAVGGELWRADAEGSALLGGFRSIESIAVHRGRLLVLGGGELHEWDGTRLVFRAPAPAATFLASAGANLYANVATLAEGQELHVWNEALGLFLSTGDLSPGPGSSSPSPPVALGPRVLFTAWTPETGREPFAWDVPVVTSEQPRGCGCGAGAGAPLLAAAAFAWARRRRAVN